jgi:hypothetical protein
MHKRKKSVKRCRDGTSGTSGVPSRPGVWLDEDAERLKRLQIAAYNASAYQHRVASKGVCGGAQPVTRPRGPPVIGGIPTGVSQPPVSGAAPAGVGRPPVNKGAPAAASATWYSSINIIQNGLIAMQMQLSAML